MYSDSPFSLRIDGRAHLARVADEARDEAYLVDIDGATHGFDLLDEVLDMAVVDPRRGVTLDFGRFALELRRVDGRVRYRAAAVAGGRRICTKEHLDEERALWELAARLPGDATPRACFFCRWSDVEPNTGWGNLACFVERADEYHQIATQGSARERKWVTAAIERSWVDDWHSCARWEPRPVGYGYRGRPGDVGE